MKGIAGGIAASAAALLTGGLILAYQDRHVLPVSLATWNLAGVSVTALGLTTSAGGFVLAAKRPGNPIGWLALAAGLSLAITDFGHNYAVRALVATPGSLPYGHLAMWLYYLADVVTWCCLALALLLFPDGGLPAPRWRPAAWCAGGIVAATVASAAAGATRVWSHPFQQPLLQVVIPTVLGVRLLLYPLALAISVAAVVTRFIRSSGAERRQLTWFAAAAALVGITAIPVLLTNSPTSVVILDLALICLEATLALAVLRYRLYDIDIVISRTVQYGTLAAFIAAVYSGLVIGVGTLAGDEGSPLLAAVAAAVVAVAFEPVRRRAGRLANRLVYGHRATPYQVLSDFARRIGGGYSSEEALPQMARIVAAATGADQVVVWLRVGDELRPAAASNGHTGDAPLAIAGQERPLPAADFSVPVTYQDELLGAIAITMPKSEPLRPAGEQLVADIASHAGLLLSNVGLVADLRASRQRLVTAQDAERRRLEQNLHDGAQQDLVSLAIRLNLAATTVESVAEAREVFGELKAEATAALANLRDLARGIYPPLLADLGLAAALTSQARKSALPVAVDADGLGRFPQDTEAAVYFCCLEALQNTAKYAGASQATVAVRAQDATLCFTVSDDGAGFDAARTPMGAGLRNMSDRLAALGGRLDVRSAPGGGTTIAGSLPIPDSR
jgi:signal transduction histidine kinase